MTSNSSSNSLRRGASVCGLGGLALASVLLLCGAGNVPVENFTPQGPMQADLNIGGHNVTNAATISAANVTVSGSLTAANFTLPFASVTGNPLTLAGGKTLTVDNSLTLAGDDSATLNIGAGGTLGSAAFAATNAFLAPSAIGVTVQGFNANATTLGNAVNGANELVRTDGNGLLIDAVQRPAAKTIHVSQDMGSDTRTGLSKYSLHTPFATLTAAAAAATAGDTIVAEDGVFTDKNLVLATGVNWFFLPGATVTVTDAVNGDVIFKDNGAAVTALVAGSGQTFSISSAATSAQVEALAVTGASTVTMQNLSLQGSSSSVLGTVMALYSNNAAAVINITGNLSTSATDAASNYTVYIDATGGGIIHVTGDVTATTGTAGVAIKCASNTTSSGTVTVTGCVSSDATAFFGSSACNITCGTFRENANSGSSYVYNHLTLFSPALLFQTEAKNEDGFTTTDIMGPQDHLITLTLPATLATGTVSLPQDGISRLGERVTIMPTQPVTSLTIVVPDSGTLEGYTPATVGPGSITFEKIGSNTWLKL